jgi:hypothetical protein
MNDKDNKFEFIDNSYNETLSKALQEQCKLMRKPGTLTMGYKQTISPIPTDPDKPEA